jgi:ABC-type ATPase involved in cell division
MGGHGGGVLDVLALVLRAAVLRSTDGRQVLVADEPMKFVNSPDALERMKRLLSELSRRGLQIILVSSRGDTADMDDARVFEFTPSEDGTSVRTVSR